MYDIYHCSLLFILFNNFLFVFFGNKKEQEKFKQYTSGANEKQVEETYVMYVHTYFSRPYIKHRSWNFQ